ncbi:MAG TPA: response regulator transcription factor [Lachnospiraceae bacterium]|nr:response regulator transcription factor [Lachnospiraceae bacterium]
MERIRKVLVVEDEEKIASVIQSFLEKKGYQVTTAPDGRTAIDLFDDGNYSLILLDLMLPGISGEEVCKAIRSRSKVPIIILTAKSDEANMLTGLELGADDYVTKPFSLKTLHARIEAVLRRAGTDYSFTIGLLRSEDGRLVANADARTVSKGNEELKLTPYEFKILVTLMKSPNKVFTREELIAAALGEDYEGYDRAIDSHIKNLRQKLEEDPKNPTYVKTIHGVGYRFGGA